MATFSAALREWKAKATTNDGGISCLQRRRASVDRLLESGLAVDANRLPVFLPAPVEGIALARALLRGAHGDRVPGLRSEEHTSELQSLMRISYAVFCLKKKQTQQK